MLNNLKRPRYRKILPTLMISIVIFALGSIAVAANEIAVSIIVKGRVDQKTASLPWAELKMGDLLDEGDFVKTGTDGFTSLIFTDDKSQVKIRPDSEIIISTDVQNGETVGKKISMQVGQIFVDLDKPKGSFIIATPTSIASVKGTEFWILVTSDGMTQIITLEGVVEVTSRTTGETDDVGAGNSGRVGPDGNIEIEEIDEEEVPTFGIQEGDTERIEIQFQDEEGNTKRAIIQYRTEE
ncbi:FecR domain-containing protein [bacterium]|nr:FecR domain-containing protein [bacterium]